MLCDSRAAVIKTSSYSQTQQSKDLCDSEMLCSTFWGASPISARVSLPSLRVHSVPIKILL